MAFRLWHAKSRSALPPALVALNLSAALSQKLEQAAAVARIPFSQSPPTSGDYILALTPAQERPVNTAPHIPVVDATSSDLTRQIEEALLYLEAHYRLKQ
jgi:hypothetical protein